MLLPRRAVQSGRLAGTLLADALCLVADGGRPAGIIGAAHDAREAIHRTGFPDGAMTEALAWLATPALTDHVLVSVPLDVDEVRLHLPRDDEGQVFDVVVLVRFLHDRGALLSSSLPGYLVSNHAEPWFDDFQDGLAEGLERHPRTSEIRRGFGALGDYDDEAGHA